MNNRVVCIVQARMRSTRLPGKSMMEIGGLPMIVHVLRAAKAIEGVSSVILTTPLGEPGPLGDIAQREEVVWSPLNHSDLLGCFFTIARANEAKAVVRITGDCPLLDPLGSSWIVARFGQGSFDYLSNVGPDTDGLDTEVISIEALRTANFVSSDPYERHHVTPFIRRRPDVFRLGHFVWSRLPQGQTKWSVDTQADLDLVRAAYANQVQPIRPS